MLRSHEIRLVNQPMCMFHLFDEVKPGQGVRSHRFMFDDTRWFTFTDPDSRAWLKTEVAILGRHVELWRVRSSGHEVNLEEQRKITYLLPLKGRLDVAIGDTEYSAHSGAALLLPPNSRKTRVSPPSRDNFDALVITIPQEKLTEALWPGKQQASAFEPTLFSNSNEGLGLSAYVTFLGAELARTASPIGRPKTLSKATSILEELVIDFLAESSIEPTDRSSTSIGVRYVRHAEEMMRARLDEPIRIVEICNELGVSMRSLQSAFREHRSISPREALDRMRLNEARKRLADPSNDQTVSAVAFESGFAHLGRFASTYYKAFGELPSETLRSIRKNA